MRYCFGIDVGGTTVKCGLFTVAGEVLDKWEIKTSTEDNGAQILPDIAKAIEDKLAEKKIAKDEVEGVGIGVPGPVNENGEVPCAVNLHWGFKPIEKELKELTGIGLARAEYPMDITQNQDVFVEVSGLLKAMAVNLIKIANDLRLMNSGPYGGIGELHLKPMQTGSTIMPGKVNPVIPEMVIQTSIKVMANDSAISMAASHGEFELNAFMPLIADSLLES